jgi:enoyl-CoA hydratase
MTEAAIRVERRGGVVRCTLDRPPLNLLEPGLIGSLQATFESLAADPTVRVAVVTGAGRAFTGGMDVRVLRDLDAESATRLISALHDAIRAVHTAPFPVIAAVNGHALGGGLVLPLACDVLIATRADCKLGLTEVVAGVPFPAAPLAVCRHRLSASAYNNLCLTGRVIGPREALALGVADELAEPEQLVARACEVAATLAGYAAYARVKDQVRAAARAEMAQAVAADPLLTGWLSPRAT